LGIAVENVFCERVATVAGGDDVHAHMAQRGELAGAPDAVEPSEPPATELLEHDALDGILSAERDYLVQARGGGRALREGARRADPRSRRAGRLCGGLPAPGRPAPRAVHRRDLLRRARAAEP